MRLPAASLPNTIKYVVGLSDTITHIALQFNTTPTELSRLNHLSSSFLYPGQSLIVPIKPANISTIVPQHVGSIIQSTKHDVSLEKEIILNQNKNIDNLLINNEIPHSSDDEILRKYLKVKSKYVTDGHGVVSGVLLVTPQTVMFNPCVSDHLVMERGVDMYVVRLPLRAISRIILFEDIAAMVVGDLAKQYMPKVEYLDYQVDYLSPKPGMVICQETGEKYVIPTTSARGKGRLREKDGIIKRDMGSPEFAIEIHISQESIESSKVENDQSVTDLGIGSSHEFMSSDLTVGDITMTSQLSEPPLSAKGECEGFSDFIHQSQLSSTPKHKTTECLANDPTNSTTQKNIAQIGLIVEKVENEFCPKYLDNLTEGATSVSSTDNLLENLLSTEVGGVPNDVPENQYVFANLDEDSSQCPENVNLIEDHFDQTPDCADEDKTIRMLSVPIKSAVKEDIVTSSIASLEYSDVSQSCNLSKDSGTSDGSFASSPIHDANDRKAITHCATLQQTTSLLSDEARQWLGKRGVKLSLDDESWGLEVSGNNQILKEDITPRPATKVDDHLMYVALKVDKNYWCPIRAKHNQIMGIPPNRDQKRREHWFAVPKDKVDQFYNFLLYWSPDLYGDDSSGFSTPCSSECDNLEEKLLRVDNKGSDICRSRSLHSVSSKSSTCSLGGDEMPDLQTDSQLLSKLHIQKLMRKLPSRTVGHIWELVYSTTIHGISLSTLYRNCQGYDSPILIVIKDENQKVFGAFLSEAPKVSEGFFGTGESMLFSFVTDTKMMTYMWTGNNNFFIKGSKTSFLVGGGEGVFGLWLDEDLYHGHSHSCKTFGNDTLSSHEDFICCGLEAWGFV